MAAFFSLAISSGCGVGVRKSTIVNKVLARSATSKSLSEAAKTRAGLRLRSQQHPVSQAPYRKRLLLLVSDLVRRTDRRVLSWRHSGLLKLFKANFKPSKPRSCPLFGKGMQCVWLQSTHPPLCSSFTSDDKRGALELSTAQAIDEGREALLSGQGSVALLGL